MGDVVNLRRARKAKQRLAGAQAAAEARLLHGRSKAERAVAQAEADRLDRIVGQSRLTKPDQEQDPDSAG